MLCLHGSPCVPVGADRKPFVCGVEMGDFYYVVVYLCYLCLTFALPSLPRRESARVSPQPGCESGYSHPAHMTLSLTLSGVRPRSSLADGLPSAASAVYLLGAVVVVTVRARVCCLTRALAFSLGGLK